MKDTKSMENILSYSKIIFYGIGNQFKECYKLFEQKDTVLFDSFLKKAGTVVNGKMIYPPSDLPKHYDSSTAVVISSIYKQHEIAKMLCSRWMIPSEHIYMYTSESWEKYIYRPELVEKNWDQILKCRDLLADEASREYYMNSIQARMKRSPLMLYPNPNCRSTGEYGEAVTLKQGDLMIDCGAYTGDTAALYIDRLKGNCTVFAVEPFQLNYDAMLDRIRLNKWQKYVKPYNCALGEHESDSFIQYNDGDFGMAVNLSSEKGERRQPVKVETLDHLFFGKKVSYIKMDIEGEECSALKGAVQLISANKPRLLISAYHRIEDLWRIPEIIWDINSSYKIFAGHAPDCSAEAEFYCIDKSEADG